jgi:hypothetical protein
VKGFLRDGHSRLRELAGLFGSDCFGRWLMKASPI